MSRAPFKAQRLRGLQGEGRSDSCNITVSKHLQKVSSLRTAPPTAPLKTSGAHARTCAFWACATSVEVDHTASLCRSIPPNRIGAHATKANPLAKSHMQRDAKGGSSVTSCHRTRMLLFTTEGGRRETGYVRLPSVNHTRRSERWGGREEGGAVSHINCCWSREKKKKLLWQEYLQCMWAWACWKSWWKESSLVKSRIVEQFAWNRNYFS